MEQEKIQRFLTDLGDDPDAIAAYLEGQGIKGELGNPYECPISILLNRTFPNIIGFGVTQRSWSLYSGGMMSSPHPPGVAHLIRRFDNGEYPSLIAPR